MSAQVNVLAVMDRQIGSLRRAGVAEVGDFAEIVAARAAVAELIEALSDCVEAEQPMAQMHAAERGRVALARVSGGAA
mgnify:CR=1 FL=1